MALLRGTSTLTGAGEEFPPVGTHPDDAFVTPVCRIAAERANVAPSGYIDQATWNVAMAVLGEEAAQDTLLYGRTGAWLGYNARTAECEALDVDEAGGAVRQVLETFRGEKPDWHWYDILIYCACDMGTALWSDDEHNRALLENTLPPGGMARRMFDRYHKTLMVQLMVTPDKQGLRDLPGLSGVELDQCWHCGYLLRACDADLPPEGRAAIRALTD
jgi:hypothetical protein